MTQPAIKYPVELLRDGKGIYGIGVAKEVEIDHRPQDLLLRRDRLAEFETYFGGYPVLQMITGGFRHGMFTHMLEVRSQREFRFPKQRVVAFDALDGEIPW
jgi:hypothetical protein